MDLYRAEPISSFLNHLQTKEPTPNPSKRPSKRPSKIPTREPTKEPTREPVSTGKSCSDLFHFIPFALTNFCLPHL